MSCSGISRAAQPFIVPLLRRLFPKRPLVLITEGLKSQEGFFQDVETWLGFLRAAQTQKSKPDEKLDSESRDLARPALHSYQCPKPLFYPAWEILPHEGKLPHVDVISERLQTLAALAESSLSSDPSSPIIITNVSP